MEVYDEPLTLFKDALPNPLTRDKYERLLNQFLKFMPIEGQSLQERTANFAKKAKDDPNWASSSIMKWILNAFSTKVELYFIKKLIWRL